MVKVLNSKSKDKTKLIILSTIPIWQPISIYQKTVELMSLETPIREHSIPQDPKFEKRQIDRQTDGHKELEAKPKKLYPDISMDHINITCVVIQCFPIFAIIIVTFPINIHVQLV